MASVDHSTIGRYATHCGFIASACSFHDHNAKLRVITFHADIVSDRPHLPACRLDDVHVDAIVAEVLRRLDRPSFEAPTYAVDLESRVQVQLAN